MTDSPSRRWMTPPPIYESRRITRDATGLKPYLTLPYLLSLTWLAYPLISLLFIAFRLQISSSSAQDAVSDAKSNLLTSCQAAEKAATVAASLPRYMAEGSNKQIADAVNGTMNAARAALVLALTILEGLLNFVIDIYRSTFFCFVELVVQGGLSVLIGAVQEINSFLSNTFSGLRTSIQGDIASANSVIKTAIDGINKVNPFGDITAPQITVPSLDALQNVTLPSDFQDALLKLNSSLPTVSQVKDAIESVVDTPFEDLKKSINDTFGGLSFDASVLPVPQQQTLSFCDQMDTSVVDDLGKDLLKAAKIGTIILIILAFLLLGAYCALEWYKWRCLKQHLEYTRQAWITDPTMQNAVRPGDTPVLLMTDHNLMMLSASSAHPLLSRIANRLSGVLKLSQTKQTTLHWFFHYIFHPPALACFLIGFLGLLSVELQLLAIRPLEAKYDQQVTASINNFSNTIATSVNQSMYNQSSLYANDINGRIDTMQSSINDGLFGWVNGTTTTLNSTLNNFYSDIQTAVSFVFNGTVLENPMQQFIFCIIGTKVEAIENAITFLHDNLIVDIPRVNQSVLVLSQANVDEATQPIAQAAIGGGNGDSQGLVGRLISRYVDSLKLERIMFLVFVGLWLIVVFMGLCIIWWHSYGKRLFESKEKRRWREQQGSVDTVVLADKSVSDVPRMDEKGPAVVQDAHPASFAPSLTPLEGGFFNSVNLRTPVARQSSLDNSDSNNLRPPFERSWDSYIDSSTGPTGNAVAVAAPTGREISGPRKLMAIGRKAMGRERFVSDEERARQRALALEDDEDEEKESGWLKRFTSVFRGKKEDTDVGMNTTSSDSLSDADSSRSTRSKPKLTITTSVDFSNVARDQLPTAGGDVPMRCPARSPNGMPGSAWSISPGPSQPVPWFTRQPSTAAKNLAPQPQRPQQRRKVSMPSSVNSAGDASFPSSPAAVTPRDRTAPQTPYSAYTPSGVPSYYQSNVPHQYQLPRDSLLPENFLTTKAKRDHRRSSSVPLPFLYPNQPGKLATIHEPAITTAGGKHLSQAADPFRTPFDDDALGTNMNTTNATNPFSP